jgi:hypothetical protein
MSTLVSQLGGQAAVEGKVLVAAAVEAVLLGPLDVQLYDRFTVYVTNTLAVNPVSTLKLQTAPTVGGPWVDVDATLVGAPLAASTAKFQAFDSRSDKYIQIVGTSVDGTTVNIYLSIGGLT